MAKYKNDPLLVERTARFSRCRSYRYTLDIVWDDRLPMAAFIGLNPSTADEYQDDPTVRRCRGFAESWSCGGMRMLNLFAYRATLPADMKAQADPVGAGNRLPKLLQGITGPRIACWGTHGSHKERARRVSVQLGAAALECLGMNADGSPKHPLYLRSDSQAQPYRHANRDAAVRGQRA